MILDHLDFYIILSILRGVNTKKPLTTWEMAKSYCWGEENTLQKSERFYLKKAMTITSRLNKMRRQNLLEIKKDGRKNVYILKGDRVTLKKHQFITGMKDSIQILGKDEKWIIFEI